MESLFPGSVLSRLTASNSIKCDDVASMTGQAVDTATLDNPVLRQEVLDRLIQDALLQGQAIDRRIHVGDMRLMGRDWKYPQSETS